MDNVKGNLFTGKLAASQYYVHNSYINTWYYVYKYVEKWLSDNLFRKDPSRVFLASDGYAFRRRFELTDMSKSYEEIEFSSLNLPFANYWPQNSGWVVDNRVAAKSAALIYIGTYVGNTKIKATPSTLNIPVTLWYDREDDARMAYEILYYKSYNEQYHSTKVPYGRDTTLSTDEASHSGNVLDLPVNITITNLSFNPSYNEISWLKAQRIFVVKANLTVRSYVISPPKQPNYDVLSNGDGTLSDGSAYEDGYNYYYVVDDVIMNFSSGNENIQSYDAGYKPNLGSDFYAGSSPFPFKGERGVLYVDTHKDADTGIAPSIYVWDSLNESYITPDYQTDSSHIRVSGDYDENLIGISRFDYINGIDIDCCEFKWEYDSDDVKDSIETIEFHIATTGEIFTADKDLKSILYGGLTPNTTYYGYVVFKTFSGNYKKLPISFTTKADDKGKEIKAPEDSLVGLTF